MKISDARIFTPEIYHGSKKQNAFFEGWYFKLTTGKSAKTIAIIPGIFKGENGYAFIQILIGETNQTHFIKFPKDQFQASEKGFDLWVGENHFTLNNISLDIKTEEINIQGEVQLSEVEGWPISILSPGIMGVFAYVPFMECYHGVLGFNPKVDGALTINKELYQFDQGKGYIEKDWGKSFPSAYVWMQSNHFPNRSVSFSASVALIPWIGFSFSGFIVGLTIDGELYSFATYNNSKIAYFDVTDEEINIQFANKHNQLKVCIKRVLGGELKGPTRENMEKRIFESLNAEIKVELKNRLGEIIFAQAGINGGLEVHGDMKKLG
jgi:tocopherol cyclase